MRVSFYAVNAESMCVCDVRVQRSMVEFERVLNFRCGLRGEK